MRKFTRFTAAPIQVITTASIIISTTNNSLGLAFSTALIFDRIGLEAFPQRRRCQGHAISSSTSTLTSEGDFVNRPSGGRSCVVELNINEVDESNDSHRFNAQVFASSNCWGRQPLLIRGAFDPNLLLERQNGSDDDVDTEESVFAWPNWRDIVEIASDDDSESRIISHIPGNHASFDVRLGPLAENDVERWLSKPSNPSLDSERRETLVVNDIDRFYPLLADWMHDTFRFIPNWRMDDGQISLAEQGGGIGPHVDNYDVFLIQMSGMRTWQVGRRDINPEEERDRLIDGLDVRVLDGRGLDTGGDEEMDGWTVYPGDLLYLPPRIAHCGTSLSDDCMTLSVGCRAPSVSDLVSKLAEKLSTSVEVCAVRRYKDDDILSKNFQCSAFSPGELTAKAKERARRLLMDSLASAINDDEWWDEFFGRYATEQKRVRNNYPISLDDWADSAPPLEGLSDDWKDAKSIVRSVLAGEGVLYHAEGISFACSCIPSSSCDGRLIHRFYANGDMWQSFSQSNDTSQNCMQRIFLIVSNNRRLNKKILLGTHDSQEGIMQLSSRAVLFLEQLVSAGLLYGSED